MRRRARRRLAAMTGILALVVTACGGDIDQAGSPSDPPDAPGNGSTNGQDGDDDPDDGNGGALSADLLGSGASFPNPLYQTLIGEFREVEPGVIIQYESIGSSGGKQQLIGELVDFAGTDSVMSDGELEEALAARGCTGDEVLHIPTVFGGVVLAYNIDGLDELTLDGETIAGIFSGEIETLDDPAIAALNEGVDLPSQRLTPAVRADGSGTTSIFSTYLNDESATWAEAYGRGSEIDWFDGVVAGEQNDGVAAVVAAQPGAIGYLSLEYAVAAGLPFASVVNADGVAVTPTTSTVSAAAGAFDLPEDLRFNVLGVGGEGYPIAGATWMLAWTCGYDEGDAEAIKAFFTYIIEEGGAAAEQLGYAPLAGAAKEQALGKVARINEEG